MQGKPAATRIQSTAPLTAYGHSENMPQTIDGLELLKNFLEEQEGNAGPISEQDEWRGWDVQSESESSDAGSWISVDSDGPDFQISDDGTDDEAPAAILLEDKNDVATQSSQAHDETMMLATTKVR